MCDVVAENNKAGQDTPVLRDEDDRFGFVSVADGLATSLLALDGESGCVTGIEGRWGAGKTSLLNLLLARLEDSSPAGTHVLRFSPWLSGPGGSLAEALLLPVADIIRQEEERRQPGPHGLRQHACRKIRGVWRWLARKRNEGTLLEVLNYLQLTSGRLAPIADFAGNFVPGFSLASKGMDALAKADLSARRATAAQLRDRIESSLGRLGLTFIIVIDDLDRLEPAQAVEVLRLVRSVADFSRFRYVMCYDRDVLAHAVEQGVGVENGRLYLQKIVPLSFSLPRPEAFTLRQHFCAEAVDVFRHVNGREPDAKILNCLKSVVSVYGEALSTPREVRQALSAISFHYPGLRDYVWFPDLCLLQLLRVVNPVLYDWAEHYLSERAVVVTGDGAITEEEEKLMSASLNEALKAFSTHAARSVFELSQWLPGISRRRDEGAKVFLPEAPRRETMSTTQRRLASPVYWRYYFAFSAPGNVLSEADIQEIVRLAAEDTEGLMRRLLESVTDNGVSSRTWYEHILTRLTPAVTLRASQEARRGLLSFLFSHGDEVLRYYKGRGLLFRLRSVGMEDLATQLSVQMLAEDRPGTLSFLEVQLGTVVAVVWAADYLREMLWQHGVVGNQRASDSELYLSGRELKMLRQKMADRMETPEIRDTVLEQEGAGSYLWAWRDIAGVDAVRRWFEEECREDAAFLRLLLKLRTHVSSSNRGDFLRLKIGDAEQLIETNGLFQTRLDDITARNDPDLSELLQEVNDSINNNRDF